MYINTHKKRERRKYWLNANYIYAGISRSERDLPPAHYSLKIESCSELVNKGVEKYETNIFEAGGYKWFVSLSSPIDKFFNIFLTLYLLFVFAK